MHLTLAKFTGVDELEIDNEEAAMLSQAVTEVAAHYSVAIDPKVMAWIGFAGVAGAIYGPRIGAYKLRKSIEKGSAAKETKANPVVPATAPVNVAMPDAWMMQR